MQSNNDDGCSQSLLTIVARGSAIITELYRLVELVPAPFRHHGNDDKTKTTSQYYLDKEKKYTLDNIVCDFSYFKQIEQFESKIESDEMLKKADENFCDNFVDILTRFYLTFDSIQRYASDLNRFIADLEDEIFVGQSLEALLLDTENRQLLCEAYFLLGYMLITTDNYFEGGLRERLIVSYYRYSSYKSLPDSCLDATCNLMRSTGFKTTQQKIYRTERVVAYQRPNGYPENFFTRVNVNQSVVNLLIAKLQSLDIYNQTAVAFPNPDHRSTALAQQASILYVLLYFCPNILKSQRSRMREITDKFFYDNWVISVFMGELVNLIEAWAPYKAARESLCQLLDVEGTRSLTNQYHTRFYRTHKHIQEYLQEGWLNVDSVLDNYAKIINQIREANVVLRWMLLHSQMVPTWQLKLTKVVYSLVIENQPDRRKLYEFLQGLTILERKFSSLYDKLLSIKDIKIQENRSKASEMLGELVSIYNDKKPMRWVKVDSNLANILEVSRSNLETIDFKELNSRDIVIKLINGIESAREVYSDDKSLQVVQLFMDIKESLLKLLRYLGLPDGMHVTLQSIGDFSYAWRLMDENFTKHMQQVIKDDSTAIYGIESIFLKLVSAFDTLLIRIQQVNSQADLISVSQYYSTKLVSYMRSVLHIIPATILDLVSSIIAIQTDNVLGDMPSKIPLDSLKDYALPGKRARILELTSKISRYAEGMVMMQNTSIGLIRINSKQLLEDGIRSELVQKMSDSIQNTLRCPEVQVQNNTTSGSALMQIAQNLFNRLTRLTSVMNGYKRSFEYIQDYLLIYGLRMWQEELSRIVNFNVEQVTLALTDENISNSSPLIDQQSAYQSSKAPIPVYGENPLQSSFIIFILDELLKITNPRETIYDEQVSAWFEQKSHDQVVDLKVFDLIISSLGTTGLNGIDQLCCTLLMLELQELNSYLLASTASDNPQSQSLAEALQSIEDLRLGKSGSIQTNLNKQASSRIFTLALGKLAPHNERIVNHLLRVGQLQAIRMNISCVLSTKCRYEARHLFDCLNTLNATLLTTLKQGKKQDQHKITTTTNYEVSQSNYSSNDDERPSQEAATVGPENLGESQLVFELTNHLEWIGLSDPLSKIYTFALQATSSSQINEQLGDEHLVASINLIFMVVLEQSSKFQFSRSISGFVPKQSRSFYESSANVDGQPLFYGIVTLLNHYQPYLVAPDSKQKPVAVGVDSQQNGINNKPLVRLLQLMSLYVKCSIDLDDTTCAGIKPHELTLELANMILSLIELLRLARQSSDELIRETLLPKYIADTFQYTICHLSG